MPFWGDMLVPWRVYRLSTGNMIYLEIYQRNCYTTWKVDDATPMYWFTMAPKTKPPFRSCAIYFRYGVSKYTKYINHTIHNSIGFIRAFWGCVFQKNRRRPRNLFGPS